jgi:hypothetical protein
MKRRSVLASMGAFTASGSLVMGSGAFTSAEVERDVNIDVVPDDEGFLGLLYPDAEGNAERNSVDIEGGGTDLLFATNQFGLDAEITSFSAEILGESCLSLDYEDDLPSSFTTGKGVQVQITEDCSGDCPEKTTVEISAEGGGFSVEAERTFDISCSDDVNQGECGSGSDTSNCLTITGPGDITGGNYDCITFDIQGNGNDTNGGGPGNSGSGVGNAEILIEDVQVTGSVCIQEAGTQDITIKNSTISGDVNIDIFGDVTIYLDNICVNGIINDNLQGNATLIDNGVSEDCD